MSDAYARLEAAKLQNRIYFDDQVAPWLAAARQTYPMPTNEQLRNAQRIVEAELSSSLRVIAGPPETTPPKGLVQLRSATAISFAEGTLRVVSGLAAAAVLLAFLLRGGLLFRFFGITVVTSRGARASRARCLGRAVAAWAWAPALLAIFANLAPRVTSSVDTFLPLLVVVMAAIFLAVVVRAVLRPERGLPDLVAGTFLVPR